MLATLIAEGLGPDMIRRRDFEALFRCLGGNSSRDEAVGQDQICRLSGERRYAEVSATLFTFMGGIAAAIHGIR